MGKLAESASLVRYIGCKAKGAVKPALEAAIGYVAEFAEVPTIAALAHVLGEEEKAECEHEFVMRCAKCGVRE
jgi:hypothetical protein